MWNKIMNWLKRFWGVIPAFIALVGVMANATALIEFTEDHLATPTPLPSPTSTDTPIPTVSPTPTLGPFVFLSFPSQVRAGQDQDAEVVLQARPGDVCVLDFYTPNGTKSTTDGLGAVTVNSQARCVWKWHISANTEPGMATLVITIQDVQESHEFEILPKE